MSSQDSYIFEMWHPYYSDSTGWVITTVIDPDNTGYCDIVLSAGSELMAAHLAGMHNTWLANLRRMFNK